MGGKCVIGEMVTNPMGSGKMLSLQRVNDLKTWYSNRKISQRGNKGKRNHKNLGVVWLEHPKGLFQNNCTMQFAG